MLRALDFLRRARNRRGIDQHDGNDAGRAVRGLRGDRAADSASVMADDATAVRIPLQLLRGCVVASIQVELSPGVLDRFQRDLHRFRELKSGRLN